ncbi:MAG: tetratricopeptide repeat protein [Acidobacteriaceae bacterium]|nr:tetratricopeptide repeat protein [Acidobacteriaceae bacterium]
MLRFFRCMVREHPLKKATMSMIESLTEAVKQHQAGRLESADARYRQILCQQPDHADALNALGVLMCQVGRPDQAITLIGHAVAVGDAIGQYGCNLGEAFRAAGRLDEAVTTLRLAVTRNPTDTQSHYNLGLALQKLDRHSEAMACFETAIQHDPRHFDSYFSLAGSLQQIGRIEDAIAGYDRIIDLFPEQTQAVAYRQEAINQRDAAAEEESLETLSEQEIYLRLSRHHETRDSMLYRGLCQAIQNGQIRIEIDLKRINHLDCPVAGDAFSTQFLYAVLIVAGLVAWFLSWPAGIGVLVASVLAYWTRLRRVINRRTKRYVLKQIAQDGALWDRLWRFGGVSLSCPGKEHSARCDAPADDWRAFVTEFLKTV